MAVAAVLAVGSVVAFILAPPGEATPAARDWGRALEWRPGISLAQPWRWWTAAWLHWSGPHLAGNLLGDAIVALLGWRARAPVAAALAWLCAWPLTQALFDVADPAWLGPQLREYGGLSGVLHAGVVIAGLGLIAARAPSDGALTPAQVRRHRAIGAALVAGTLIKVLLEAPWNPSLRPNALLGIEVAPIAHAFGFAAGTMAFAASEIVLRALQRRRG